jgi:hypothetical protein
MVSIIALIVWNDPRTLPIAFVSVGGGEHGKTEGKARATWYTFVLRLNILLKQGKPIVGPVCAGGN